MGFESAVECEWNEMNGGRGQDVALLPVGEALLTGGEFKYFSSRMGEDEHNNFISPLVIFFILNASFNIGHSPT